MSQQYCIIDWACQCSKQLADLGVKKHEPEPTSAVYSSIPDKDVFEAAKLISLSGLNVMICHTNMDKEDFCLKNIIYVDTRRFQAR
jgi:hypothetical protein